MSQAKLTPIVDKARIITFSPELTTIERAIYLAKSKEIYERQHCKKPNADTRAAARG